MNGKFFKLSAGNITSMTGKYLSPYNSTWVISKEPERSPSATEYGSTNEWQVLFNLATQNWYPVPAKVILEPVIDVEIVDVNIVGPFVDYVVRYHIDQETVPLVQYKYFRDRNVDGVFSTANYSRLHDGSWDKSIIGPYEINNTYIKLFNNSVMLYPNLRMVINGNVPQTYSYTVSPSRIGTILIPFGDLQEDFLLSEYQFNQKRYLITKTATGYIRIIKLGTNIPERVERIGQYVHKINTVDVINILVERETRITAEHGSLDWNNKFEIINNVGNLLDQGSNTYHVNSAYNPLYETTGLRSASMIISDTTFTLFGTILNQKMAYGYTLSFINAKLSDGSIDVFYDNVQPAKYKYTLTNGIQRINSQLEGLSFPLGVFLPFPLGTKWNLQNEVTAVGQMSLGLLASGTIQENKTLDIYNNSAIVYFGQAVFDLFGVQYIFDGDYIYQDSTRVAMAFGFMFIGRDPNAAYFYNPWDKSIYQFTGSRSLVKFLNLSNRTTVKIGRYDGFSGEMVLLTEDEILKSRDGVIMNFPYVPGENITSTKLGPYVTLADGSRQLLAPKDGEIDPFEVITGFMGVDGSTVCDFERIDIRLDSQNRKPFSFIVEMQTINQDTKESEQKRIEIKPNEWSSDGYKTIKLIPQHKKGTGLSLRIYSEQEIDIDSIDFTYAPVSRTANGQRSGF